MKAIIILLLFCDFSEPTTLGDEDHKMHLASVPPLVDLLREDDHGEFDLYNLIAMSQATIDHPQDEFTNEQKQLIVDHHNAYRANLTGVFPQGSSMVMMEWNNTLAWTAKEFCKMCRFAHDRAQNDNMTHDEQQNLYQGTTKEPLRPIYLFYMEHIWYFHNNRSCLRPKPPYQCGHLYLALWDYGYHVGSAMRSYCFPVEYWSLIAYHYTPAGFILIYGIHMYQYGWPCTRCEDGMLCSGKLCVPERFCSAYNLDCECVRVCKNCAKPDLKRCRCECKPGWDFQDCGHPCENLMNVIDVVVAHGITFRKSNCGYAAKTTCRRRWFKAVCRPYCGLCLQIKPGTDPSTLCCDGKVCEKYYSLDVETCECKLRCPSELCLYPPCTEAPKDTTTKATTTEATSTKASPTPASSPTRPTSDSSILSFSEATFLLLLSIWFDSFFFFDANLI